MADPIVNSIGMEFMALPAGDFVMGGDPVAEQADENETPRHRVVFDAPFAVGRTAVTQAQWRMVMGDNPSRFRGDERPVETVSHDDAIRFIERLNALEATRAYRLPTEAQWEYAARAGFRDAWCFGSSRALLDRYAWYGKNSGGQTHPVGRLNPNDWGLCDVHGNVHEWCMDWFDRHTYSASPTVNPAGPPEGLARALRGGDWGSEDWYCRCASRSLASPGRRSDRVGFRVVKCIDD